MNIEDAKKKLAFLGWQLNRPPNHTTDDNSDYENAKAIKTVLSELEKKDKLINEIEDLCIRKSDDEGEEYGGVIIWNFAHKIMEIINKVEREGG